MKKSPSAHWPFRTGIIILLAVLVSAVGSQAAEWKPTKPIEFVAPFAPGGGSDVLARSIASIIESQKLCPQPLLVVNRSGGSGLVGTTSVAQQKGNPLVLVTFIFVARCSSVNLSPGSKFPERMADFRQLQTFSLTGKIVFGAGILSLELLNFVSNSEYVAKLA